MDTKASFTMAERACIAPLWCVTVSDGRSRLLESASFFKIKILPRGYGLGVQIGMAQRYVGVVPCLCCYKNDCI